VKCSPVMSPKSCDHFTEARRSRLRRPHVWLANRCGPSESGVLVSTSVVESAASGRCPRSRCRCGSTGTKKPLRLTCAATARRQSWHISSAAASRFPSRKPLPMGEGSSKRSYAQFAGLRYDICVSGPREANVSHHPCARGVSLAISLTIALIGSYLLVAFSSAGLAGPAEYGALPHNLQKLVGNPVLQIKTKHGGGCCQLCNDKGYCLDFEDRGSCEANKSVVEKTWEASLKWSCACSRKKSKAPTEPDKAACCLVAGNPLSKICGSESKIRRALVVSNPGKLIECGPP
jgi:hypothetical protein